MKFTEEEIKSNLEAYKHLMRTGSKIGLEHYGEDSKAWRECSSMAVSYLQNDKKYRIKKPTAADYEKAQAEWIAENNVEVGDKVRIVGKAEYGERGWMLPATSSTPRHHSYDEGETFLIEYIDGDGIKRGCNLVPYFVLEKIEPKFRPWTLAEFNESGEFRFRRKEAHTWLYLVCLNGDGAALLQGKTEYTYSFSELLKFFQQADGTPCGIEVKDDE